MKEIGIAERKELMLAMMDEIDAFCRENQIPYFLIGGTLLGAVRHQGFIPWDDDMDIGIPREAYERFVKSYRSRSGNVRILDYRSSENYIWACAKAVDQRTVLLENGDRKHPIGVFIDIFPLDPLYGSYEDAVKRVKKNLLFQNALTIKHLPLNKDRSAAKNAAILLGRSLLVVPDRVLIRRINSNGETRPNGSERYICNFAGAWGVREISLAENFRSTVELPFENRRYCAPVGYDDYLTTVYGDYMTPPPENKRISHHGNIAYWRETV